MGLSNVQSIFTRDFIELLIDIWLVALYFFIAKGAELPRLQDGHYVIDAADRIANAGFAPLVPHHTHFWHMMHPRPYDEWLRLDLAFLPCCDAVLRLPGPSLGADGEVDAAKSHGIPIYYDLDDLIRALSER